MFKLNMNEKNKLVTNCDRFKTLKHSHNNPYAFTEQGVSMLSSVLKSKRAIEVSIQIIKTFVQLRRMYLSNKEVADKIAKLEEKYDKQFKLVFEALREFFLPKEQKKQRIGY